MVTKQSIINVLQTIQDPELSISLWDLGLIYGITVGKKGDVEILMTLTSVGCPLFDTIQEEIVAKVKKIRGVKNVMIELTFEPPWTVEKMSKTARDEMGI